MDAWDKPHLSNLFEQTQVFIPQVLKQVVNLSCLLLKSNFHHLIKIRLLWEGWGCRWRGVLGWMMDVVSEWEKKEIKIMKQKLDTK